MKRTSFSILFYIKKSKPLKNGDAPIYLRLTVNHCSHEMAIKRSIPPDMWDSRKGRAKSNWSNSSGINEYLMSVQSQIFRLRQTLEERSEELSPQVILDDLRGKSTQTQTILEVFRTHNQEMRSLIGIDYSKSTYDKYEVSMRHLSKFISGKYDQNDFPIKKIDLEFIRSFEHFLKIEVQCQNNSAMKHIKSLRKIILRAISNRLIDWDPFTNYTIHIEKRHREYLTQSELDLLHQKVFRIERLAQVRDFFLIQCYTGLAFIDLENLSKDHIVVDDKEVKWIKIFRQKTDSLCNIPLLPQAEKLINQYASHPVVRCINRSN